MDSIPLVVGDEGAEPPIPLVVGGEGAEPPHLVVKKYTKKNGDETIRKYNQNKYNKAFYDKHKDKLMAQHTCACGKVYTHANISHHQKSQYHLLYLKLTTPINPII